MTITKEGPRGGDGGVDVSMDNIDNITRIVKISVYYSTGINGYIHAIAITYIVDGDPTPKTVTWGKGDSKEGDSKEVDYKEIPLKTGEYITFVKGYYGQPSSEHWIGLTALQFGTNITTYGPYGGDVGTDHFIFPTNNGTIIGFNGRASSARVDALGVYIQDRYTGGSTGTTGGSTGTGNI